MKIFFNFLFSCFMKWKQNQNFRYWIFTSLFIICSSFSTSMSQQLLKVHVPAAIEKLGLKSIGRLDSNKNLHLAIGLPLRNKEGLALLLKQMYDPSNLNYRHYLSPVQFTEQFGPTEDEYQSVVDFAKQKGLTVTGTTSNRLLLDVEASVADIEKIFNVNMLTYQHPTESRTFFAPDREPSIIKDLPILQIDGLDSYAQVHPLCKEISKEKGTNILLGTGSGLNGSYRGYDFRKAYAPNVTYDGSGQTVAVLEFSGYYPGDITYYENICGLPNVNIEPILLENFDGSMAGPTYPNYELEVSLDIEMVISMAPGISKLLVFEESYKNETIKTNWINMLNSVTIDNRAKQISFSWQLDGADGDGTAENIFLEMQAQGQSFFQASGDKKAYTGLIDFPGDSPNITIVGGTTLTTADPNSSWVSEMAWNDNNAGSGGGSSTQYGIPYWQQGINMANNGGSTTMRNIPDVSLTASNIYVRCNKNGEGVITGTSCAAPLWAGFAALINQRAAENAQPPIGFINPFIYLLGKGSNYNTYFHDIISGGNTTYGAVTGFDLCTGWGTPKGIDLIEAFVPINNIQVDQKLSTSNQVGTIGKWNGSSFSPRLNPGNSILISPASTIVLQGDQNVYSGEKYSNWIRNTSSETDVSNHHTFIVQINDRKYISNFQPMYNATIQSQLLETGSIGGFLKFQDPWLIDFQEAGFGNNLRNQGMVAPFNNVNYSSTNANLGTNTSHLGVFLNQTTNLPGYYSIQAPLTQTINGHNGAFQNWDSPGATFQQVGSNPSGYDQKAVIFNNSGAIVTANYKGVNISNSTSAFTNSSQRKVARTEDGVIHLVYESMNKVWYEKSTNDGLTWTISNGGLPLSINDSKLPCIDADVNGNIGIIYQERYNSSYRIRLAIFNVLGNLQFTSNVQANPYNPVISDPYLFNSNPVIAWGSSMMVVWKEQNGLGFYRRLGYYSYPNPSDMNWTTIDPVSVNNTDDNSSNPTIDVLKDGNSYPIFHLAWQQGTTSINYCSLTLGNNSIITQSTPSKTFSAGFTNNSKPSIVSVTGGARLTWVGNRTTSGGGGASKIKAGGTTEQKAVFVDPANQTVFWSFSNNIQSSVINKSPECYSIMWSKSNTDPIQFTDSHTLQTITTFDGLQGRPLLKGSDIQLSNGNHDYLMRAVAFISASSPYFFNNTKLYTQAPPKIIQNAINNGREGIISKDNCQFYFGIGDVKVDNKVIEFIPITDSTHLQSLEDLNNYLITNPIQINNNSELYYSVQYGITDSATAIIALKANTHINFKVEILDAVTGEVLGISDNINFDSLHIFEYNNIAYQVNTEGMGSRTVKLRLKITTNSNIEYSLKRSYSTEEVILQKSKTNQRVVLNFNKVNNYDLSQNYPNPFNPSTTIKYQIPKAGNVTLKVYDILGKEVASLIDEYKNEGRYSINFNASKLASGVYIYQIKSNDYIASKKLMVIK